MLRNKHVENPFKKHDNIPLQARPFCHTGKRGILGRWAAHRRAANALGEGVMLNRSKFLASLRLLCIVPVAAAGLMASGPAAIAEPQELKMVEHATTDAVTDTGAKGDSAGDILTFANEVFDADDKNKIGTNQGVCFRTLPGKAWECFWTLSLEKGQLTVEGPFYDSGDSVLAITGGTGEFAGALGEMALSARGTDGKAYNFTYRIK
jgi:hypothetical protein